MMISKIESQFQMDAPIFGHSSFDNHEQILFCNDKDTGLKAIIGIHSTTLGPALGGTRMRLYNNEMEAINDVLRLSRGMTFKSAITGLNLGGGKAVIIGDPKKDKTPALMRRFAEFVHGLSGAYITAEDMGMETEDMDAIRDVTPYVTGISESRGGAGNPSPVTAYGVYMGMKAASAFKHGTDVLEDKVILVEGVGHVGEALVEHLTNEGAKVLITDIDKERLKFVSERYGASIFSGSDICSLKMDIYAPCALGASINDYSAENLQTDIIAGAANNQLADAKKHGEMLKSRGIIYAPDFLINAGGIINVFAELEGYGRQEIMNKTKNIYHTTTKILERSRDENITPNEAAMKMANERIAQAKQPKIHTQV
ncbi:MAG: Glu/Leu/Phe/Val dehydrogenase dimerization domain-containing protein [Flavobacteriaceae bacterium]|jgi:leucine dehydrogenase